MWNRLHVLACCAPTFGRASCDGVLNICIVSVWEGMFAASCAAAQSHKHVFAYVCIMHICPSIFTHRRPHVADTCVCSFCFVHFVFVVALFTRVHSVWNS